MPIDQSPDLAGRRLQLELTRVRKAQEAARLAALAAEIELLLLEQRERREEAKESPAEFPTYRSSAVSDPASAQEADDRHPLPVPLSDPRRLDPQELRPISEWLGEAFDRPTDDRLRAADALVEAIRRLVRSPQSLTAPGEWEGRTGRAGRAAPDREDRTRFEPEATPADPREGWDHRLQTLRSSHWEGRHGDRNRPSAAAPSSPVPWPPAAAARSPADEIGSASDGQIGVKFDSVAPVGRHADEERIVRPADRAEDGAATDLPAAAATVTKEPGRPTVTANHGDETGGLESESEPPNGMTPAATSEESMPGPPQPDQPQSPRPRPAEASPSKAQPDEPQPGKSRSIGPELRKGEGTASVRSSVVAKRLVVAADAEPATRRSRPSAWLVSLLSHVALLLALGLLSLSVPQSRDQLALSASATEASENPVETFTIESPAEVAIDQPEEVSAPAWEAESSPLGEGLTADLALDLAVGPPTPATDGLPNPAVNDLASSQLTANSDNRVQFAGIDGGGNHFVYLVDSSNSMKNFNEARQELLRSVESLREDQRFYVIFYDQQPDYMRLRNAGRDESTSLRATAANKLAVRRWAMTITQERGKSPVEALEFAFDLRPDVIFLLSDGEFSMRTEEVIREKNHRDNLFGDAQRLSIVHTIRYPGFSTSEAKKAESQMRRIAEENGGQYRNIEIR